MSVDLPPPLAHSYLVGVVNCTTPVTTPAYQNPAHRTSMVFAFTDPGRAGNCLASLSRVSTIRDALTAALSSGYAPVQSAAASDASLGSMVRPGDMWACVMYDNIRVERKIKNSMMEVRRVPPVAPPRIVYGFYNDLDKSILDLNEVSSDAAIKQAASFFLFAHIAQIG